MAAPDEDHTGRRRPDPEGLDLIESRAAELLLRLAALALILYGGYALLRPFFPLFLWAVILATALKPLQSWLSDKLGGRPRLSATLLTLAMILIALGPVAALADSLVETVKVLAERLTQGSFRLPQLPPAVAKIPLIGEPLTAFWTMATTNLEATVRKYAPLLLPSAGTVLTFLGHLAMDLIGFLLAVLLTGVFLATSDSLALLGRRLADRLAGNPNGTRVIQLATQTIRGVSRGVVGVAVLQALAMGVLLQVFGIPGAGLLAFLGLILCIMQLGLFAIVLPVLAWAWYSMEPGTALLLTVLLTPVTLVDNVLKPLLMARGLDTPAVVMLVGVVGGTLSAGLLGVFIGPIVLAVLYDLARAWIEEPHSPSN